MSSRVSVQWLLLKPWAMRSYQFSWCRSFKSWIHCETCHTSLQPRMQRPTRELRWKPPGFQPKAVFTKCSFIFLKKKDSAKLKPKPLNWFKWTAAAAGRQILQKKMSFKIAKIHLSHLLQSSCTLSIVLRKAARRCFEKTFSYANQT